MLNWFRARFPTPSRYPVYLIPRQSPDWNAIRSVDDMAPEAFDELVIRPEGTTRALIEKWNNATGQPFWTIRAAIKRIAEAQWATINDLTRFDDDVDARFGPKGEEESEGEPAELAWLVPTDDDDWVDPKLPEVLGKLSPEGSMGLLWDNWRLADDFAPREEAHSFCFTNNYGVATGYLAAGGDWASMAQHFDAQRMYFRRKPFGLQVEVVHGLGSIANKHPCCFTALEGADGQEGQSFDQAIKRTITGHCTLLQSLLRDHALPTQMAWAKQPIADQLDIFDACLRGAG